MSQSTSTFMSIGDVVDALKQEFPDVSVSKVRFLETEGLIDPERTPSGYRKFYASDLAKLRYILRLQRDQFMPLKVIRRRLEHYDPAEEMSGTGSAPPAAAEPDEDMAIATGINLSFDELVSASGLDPHDLRELEEYGLIDSHSADGTVYYDEDDLVVARIARDFSKFGLEPRHLRMYRNFADREAGLFEQIVVPQSRAGSADGRRQATQSLSELARLSKRLKHLLLKASLREHL